MSDHDKINAETKLHGQPEFSEWKCYLFGNDPETDFGITYTPQEGSVPNFFIRWMMKICFACTWVKTPSSKLENK